SPESKYIAQANWKGLSYKIGDMASLRPQLFTICLFAIFNIACGKRAEVAGAETSAQPAPAASTPGIVTLNPESAEVRQMTIEPAKAIPLPADEVSAPAKIQLNPNRVGHAVLPVPGRIARVLVKLGDSVAKGQPVILIDSPSISDSENPFLQAQSAVHQSELASAKAEADLNRTTMLYENGTVPQKELLAARTTLALAKDAFEQAQSVREQARRRIELLGLKAGQVQQ